MSANHLASSASSATRTCTSPASTPAQGCGPGKKREGETEKIRTKGQEVHREGSGGGGGDAKTYHDGVGGIATEALEKGVDEEGERRSEEDRSQQFVHHRRRLVSWVTHTWIT